MKKIIFFFILSVLSPFTWGQEILPDSTPWLQIAPPNFFIKPSQVVWEEEDEYGNFRVSQYATRGSRILIGSRQKVYNVLTDFENYDKWMPYFKTTKKIDEQHLNFIFQTKNFGDYNLTLKIEYPRRNMNGYYHWIHLTTEAEFPYSTLKAMEHNFYLYQVQNGETRQLENNLTLVELANHTKVAGLLATIPESKMREIFLDTAEKIFTNLQARLNSIEDQK